MLPVNRKILNRFLIFQSYTHGMAQPIWISLGRPISWNLHPLYFFISLLCRAGKYSWVSPVGIDRGKQGSSLRPCAKASIRGWMASLFSRFRLCPFSTGVRGSMRIGVCSDSPGGFLMLPQTSHSHLPGHDWCISKRPLAAAFSSCPGKSFPQRYLRVQWMHSGVAAARVVTPPV